MTKKNKNLPTAIVTQKHDSNIILVGLNEGPATEDHGPTVNSAMLANDSERFVQRLSFDNTVENRCFSVLKQPIRLSSLHVILRVLFLSQNMSYPPQRCYGMEELLLVFSAPTEEPSI